MNAVAITVGTSWIILGLLCIALAIPLIRGQVRRNGFYGIRVPAAFQSDDAWFAINRYGGRRLALWAVPMVVVGVVCLFLPLRTNTALTLLLGFAPLVFVFIPLVQAWRFGNQYRH